MLLLSRKPLLPHWGSGRFPEEYTVGRHPFLYFLQYELMEHGGFPITALGDYGIRDNQWPSEQFVLFLYFLTKKKEGERERIMFLGRDTDFYTEFFYFIFM